MPDGRWRIREELPRLAGQPRRRKSLYGDTPEACLEAWREWRRSGAPSPDERPTIAQLGSLWLDWLEPNGPEHRIDVSTWIGYETHLRRHIGPWLGATRPDDLTVAQIEDWLLSLRAGGKRPDGTPFAPMSPAMRRKVLTTLRSLLKWGVGRGLCVHNPAAAAGLPRKERAKRWIPAPDSELDALLAAVRSHRLRTLFEFALMLGPRMGELLAIWWTDLDRDTHSIEITHSLSWKGGQMRRKETKTAAGQRTIALPDVLWDSLMEHEKRQREERAAAGSAWLGSDTEPYVFTRTTGAPLRGDGTGGVGDQWRRLLRRCELPPRNFHQTRHLASSLLLRLTGGDLVAVHQVLGHSTYRTTVDLYSHLQPAAAEAAAQALQKFYGARGAHTGVIGGGYR